MKLFKALIILISTCFFSSVHSNSTYLPLGASQINSQVQSEFSSMGITPELKWTQGQSGGTLTIQHNQVVVEIPFTDEELKSASNGKIPSSAQEKIQNVKSEFSFSFGPGGGPPQSE